MNRKILKLAIPNIISNITVPLLGLVDTALMGHLESEVYIGAIALGGMIFSFVFWGFGFLRMGTTGFTAQAYGKKDAEETFFILMRSLGVALFGALVILVLQYPIAECSFYLLSGSEEVEKQAQSYFYIRIYAAPATISLYAITGWYLGRQNAQVPLLISLVVNVANILLNLYFVRMLGLKAEGVAWGTLGAQYIGLILALWLLWAYQRKLGKYWHPGRIFQKAALVEFFRVNNDILIRTLVLLFTFSFFYAESARFGDKMLAVNSLLLQFNIMMAYAIDGFAFAAESIIGEYIGARERNLLKKSIHRIFYLGMLLALGFSLVYGLFYAPILAVLTNQEGIIQLSYQFVAWVIIAPLINSPCFIWDGIYIGATASRAMRNSMLLATFLVFFPTYYLSVGSMDNHALWLAMSLFMISRGIGLYYLSKKHIYFFE
ncbi:MAG: MATE family efflux transporter [Bacteroidota bacterium]